MGVSVGAVHFSNNPKHSTAAAPSSVGVFAVKGLSTILWNDGSDSSWRINAIMLSAAEWPIVPCIAASKESAS